MSDRRVDQLNGYGEIIDVLETLPVILRETRQRKGQTLREAASHLGVSNVTVMNWEHETHSISIMSAVRILRWAAT